jgi:hypothetical protein
MSVTPLIWTTLLLLHLICLPHVHPLVTIPMGTLAPRVRFSMEPCSLSTLLSHKRKRDSRCFAASSSDDNSDDSGETSQDVTNWDSEETLLAINLRPLPGKSLSECLQRVSDYTQSFPFAAVLPVQPLQYLPAEDGGVDLRFLRKKTDIKSGIDGGIRFFVRRKQSDDVVAVDDEEEEEEDEDDDKESDESNAETDLQSNGIEIIAKRNSKGQTIPKMFAEKLVVQAFVRGITNGADSDTEGSSANGSTSPVVAPKTRFESPTKDMVALKSVFHKWMDVGL